MVVQGTTLVIRIARAMLVLAAITMGVMMMHVMDSTAFSEIGSNVLLVLEGMLNMGADQRNNGNCLGQQNEPEEKWTKSL
jgi:hypothetical protein